MAKTQSRGGSPIGRVVARVRLEEEIGRGATAVVYRGRHEGLGADVAVKVLLPQAASKPSVLEAFRREGRAIARVDSENVLKVYDVVSEGKVHAMVMELLDGEEVLDLVERRDRLSQIDALRILRQAALGLEAIHAQGIIHRDIKPQNIVVMPDGTVKVVDFGLAFEEGAEKKRIGTPHYLSPETCKSGHSEPASDIYSLGITFFHLLVGQPPYAGRDVPGILRGHINADPMNLDERRPGLARPVRDLFRKMTAKDFVQRPSATQLVAMVDAIGGKKLRRKQSLRRAGTRTAAGKIAAAAVAVLLAAGVGVGLMLKGQEDEEAETERARALLKAEREAAEDVQPSGPTPAELAEREAARETLRLQKEEEARRLEAEAKAILESAESWARRKWQSREDTAEVIRRYKQITGKARRTPSGEEADRRILEIEAGRLHPHPDLAWTPPEEVEAARQTLETKKEELQALIAAGRYADAKALVPPTVVDPEGTVEAEVGFLHALLDDLVVFHLTLGQRLDASPDASRELKTKAGAGEVSAVTVSGATLTIDGEEQTVPWSDVEHAEVFRFAYPFFEDAKTTEQRRLLSWCAAHGLREAYYQAAFDIDTGALGPEGQAYLHRLEALIPE